MGLYYDTSGCGGGTSSSRSRSRLPASGENDGEKKMNIGKSSNGTYNGGQQHDGDLNSLNNNNNNHSGIANQHNGNGLSNCSGECLLASSSSPAPQKSISNISCSLPPPPPDAAAATTTTPSHFYLGSPFLSPAVKAAERAAAATTKDLLNSYNTVIEAWNNLPTKTVAAAAMTQEQKKKKKKTTTQKQNHNSINNNNINNNKKKKKKKGGSSSCPRYLEHTVASRNRSHSPNCHHNHHHHHNNNNNHSSSTVVHRHRSLSPRLRTSGFHFQNATPYDRFPAGNNNKNNNNASGGSSRSRSSNIKFNNAMESSEQGRKIVMVEEKLFWLKFYN